MCDELRHWTSNLDNLCSLFMNLLGGALFERKKISSFLLDSIIILLMICMSNLELLPSIWVKNESCPINFLPHFLPASLAIMIERQIIWPYFHLCFVYLLIWAKNWLDNPIRGGAVTRGEQANRRRTSPLKFRTYPQIFPFNLFT